jgi:hypothetical protein|tara:strand:+ start:258 stop:728 length:471 start_codon:yes stop_codon:yes gene_type:complete
MATITPTLTLTSNASTASSSPGPLSIALSLSATDSLTVDTVEGQIFTIGTGANTTIVDGSALESAFTPGTNGCFIYLKNTMTSGSEVICIGIGDDNLAPAVDDGTTDLTRANTASARTFSLKAGEFAFFPFDYCGDIVAQATAASQTLEFFRFDRA